MEPTTSAGVQQKPLELDFVLGGKGPLQKNQTATSRLHILYHGHDLIEEGVKVTTSSKLAKFVNGVSWLLTKFRNCLPGAPISQRRKYVPLELSNHQIVYVNINSVLKRFLEETGKSREDSLTEAMDANQELFAALTGLGISRHMEREYIKAFITESARDDAQLVDVHELLRPDGSVTLELLRQIQFRDQNYNPYLAPLYTREDHVTKDVYWNELARARIELSGTILGDEEHVKQESRLAWDNWMGADEVISLWAKEDRQAASKILEASKGGTTSVDTAKSKYLLDMQQRLFQMLGVEFSDSRPEPGEREPLNAILGLGLQHNGNIPGVIRHKFQTSYAGTREFQYVPGKHVKGEMKDLVLWLSRELLVCDEKPGQWPILIAAQAYQRLVSIHAYADANGRTARMLMEYILQRYGLPPPLLPEHDPAVFAGQPKDMTTQELFLLIRNGVIATCNLLGLEQPFNLTEHEQKQIAAAEEQEHHRGTEDTEGGKTRVPG